MPAYWLPPRSSTSWKMTLPWYPLVMLLVPSRGRCPATCAWSVRTTPALRTRLCSVHPSPSRTRCLRHHVRTAQRGSISHRRAAGRVGRASRPTSLRRVRIGTRPAERLAQRRNEPTRCARGVGSWKFEVGRGFRYTLRRLSSAVRRLPSALSPPAFRLSPISCHSSHLVTCHCRCPVLRSPPSVVSHPSSVLLPPSSAPPQPRTATGPVLIGRTPQSALRGSSAG